MVALPSTYVPTQVEAATGGGSKVPPGKYRCVVLGGEEKENKNKDGSYVEMSYQVLEGSSKGEFIVERFNFNNKSKQAVDIAFSQFKQLAEACAKPGTMDTDDLKNCIIVVTWGPQRDPKYNEVKKREPAGASLDGYVAPSVTASPAASAATGGTDGKPAWAS